MEARVFKRALFATAALLGVVAEAEATTIEFADFSNVSTFTLNGTAQSVGGALQLNQTASTVGTAFLTQAVSLWLDGQFSTSFSFRISQPSGSSDTDGPGGDGLAFLMQTQGPNALPILFPIGYGNEGRANSLTVKFDTFFNGTTNPATNDASGNFAGLLLGGSINSVAQANVGPRMNDGAIFNAWIDYFGPSQTLEVRVGTGARPSTPTFSYTFDLINALGSNDVFIGFGGYSGTAVGRHEILSWGFITPIPEPVSMLTFAAGAIGVIGARGRRHKR
jgi:hypothetical protein